MTFQFQKQTQQVIEQSQIPAPEDKYSDWEIESLLGILYDRAIEIGEQHSQAHFSRSGKYAPLAYQASTGFKMVQIVRQLQAEIARLSLPDTSVPELAETTAPVRKTRKKSEPTPK